MCDSCAKEAERCSYCGWMFDDNGDCDCAPEGYIRPGTETIMYVNAYAVKRYYGGPEEGGWYYNAREPLASIPIKAISKDGHDDGCYNCRMARLGNTHSDNGEPYKFCKWAYELEPINVDDVKSFTKHLKDIFEDINYGSIYSVLGGSELCIITEEDSAHSNPIPHYQ
jgi:hypothetical protein